MLDPAALDRFADSYYLNAEIDDLDIEELAQRRSITAILDAIRGCDRILEMGYGTGCITEQLLAAGVAVEVLEGSPRLAEHARRRHPGLVVHTSMFEAFAPGPVYDAVLALHVLEHVDDPVALARHIGGWLPSGGTLVTVCPNRESYHRRLAVLMGLQPTLDTLSDRDRLVGHQRVYDLADLGSDLDVAGFDVVHEFGYMLKVLPNSMLQDLPPALLVALNDISADVNPRDLANIGVKAIKR